MNNTQAINLKVVKVEYKIPDNMFSGNILKHPKNEQKLRRVEKFPIVQQTHMKIPSVIIRKKIPDIVLKKINSTSTQMLIEQLLSEIYGYGRRTSMDVNGKYKFSDSERCTSVSMDYEDCCFGMRESDLITLSNNDLSALIRQLKNKTLQLGGLLAKRLCQRDSLKRRRKRICNVLTMLLKKYCKEGL